MSGFGFRTKTPAPTSFLILKPTATQHIVRLKNSFFCAIGNDAKNLVVGSSLVYMAPFGVVDIDRDVKPGFQLALLWPCVEVPHPTR